ncbi:MAG: Low molecular weight phosphotyrosine protein phosphatase [Verrucomicrobia bacterium ADurb.Bin474]|nr:MAG: Low molecular weight phosphotyrosine protein phosphatase [Verrucomicrobia bacterium ADurb.Bin474]
MERTDPKKILFVCSINKFRSYTAEKMFDGFDRYQVRSRGTEKGARIRITEGDIGWADIIFTMEKRHTNRIREKYREAIRGKTVITLFIEDIYEPMEPALIDELTIKLRRYIQVPDFPRDGKQ